ncbi:SDR family oxidoreductase [Akkermansiaceae bacterium]|nr:SDR family oxidoreductase [Akkermansiaceae bacterium]MDA8969042.1 SDR family oxidoreductase [Akkermansiaceae bacterium]MDB4373375.1 SDR family oxidoreductase [Akkermansiaceae bacterium]MDB4429203.1 SDR family oxidoreductase [Akkermansiaceae bacterium]MDB4504912.1 SDR family oxidoreductase [Akkermansiaceae bacterium]
MRYSSPAYRCVLITGASSGLGLEYARQLAPSVGTLVLVSRRGEVLEGIARELITQHPQLAVKVFASDLSEASDRSTLLGALASADLRPDLLINNAGMGDYGEFRSSEWGKIGEMIRLNVEALTHLSHALLPGLISEKGAILNVSSLASILPIPDFAVYAATKAYVTSFSEALCLEVRGDGVDVLAVCPGPVKTGFGDRARRSPTSKLPVQDVFYVAPEQVVRDSLAALARGRARIYPGFKVALAAAGIGLLPVAALRLVMSFRPRRS